MSAHRDGACDKCRVRRPCKHVARWLSTALHLLMVNALISPWAEAWTVAHENDDTLTYSEIRQTQIVAAGHGAMCFAGAQLT